MNIYHNILLIHYSSFHVYNTSISDNEKQNILLVLKYIFYFLNHDKQHQDGLVAYIGILKN